MTRIEPHAKPRVALVLGSTGRIGSAVARELASAGSLVIMQCRSQVQAAQQLCATLPGGEVTHHVIRGDLSQPGAVAALFDEVTERAGPPDIMVNALHCQFQPRPAAHSVWLDDWQPHIDSMRIHVSACQLAAAGMVERGWGRIVLISGSLAARPMVGCGAYAAVKAGLHAYQRVLALEAGPAGVTFNVVAPCRIESEDDRTATDNPDAWITLNDSVEKMSALPHDPSVREVAAAVRYLASADASAVTGQVLYLARGQVMTG